MPEFEPAAKVKVAVWKFASCDGCQLSLLDCEDELLPIAETIEFAHFLEATRAVAPGPYDVSLVEGSITTAHDVERIREVREQSKILATIGACASSGGIQALKNFARVEDFLSIVYATPEYVETLATSEPISAHVHVDFELQGCPIDKGQLLELILALANGRTPRVARHSVCVECKREGRVCVMVANGTPCLGPVTQAGCGALCPAWNRGCFGCFGPVDGAAAATLDDQLAARGADARARSRLFSTFYANAPAFRERHAPGEPDPAAEESNR